ncbi:type IV fimbriae expression regulatory protein PilR [Candidatus Thiomargarita nelsonii]|uniref:Type IV fimbriae expression regulatory protein PilR n=1 Tax=Candidatus Thiomargarita nelsonii TaxID=1003181 RepID=A0A0A6NZL0_9GAMM|nr:type IV fimbriae expression regulatory protein PilR [Candidatus Thiomargarita nelsonii]
MSKPLCLVVDDEPDILELLVMTLKPMGITCYTAETLAQAQEYLLAYEFDLCLTDMRLPDGNGIELVTTFGNQTPIVVITAHGNVESAVAAMKAGAFDFIAKPVKLLELRNLVTTALQLPKPDKQTKPAETQKKQPENILLSKLIGRSEAMQTVRAKIEKLARSQAHVYIKGESGTGKEVVAHLIHALGARAKQAFTPVNCGAIPTELMESEFFGHKKGAHSTAHNDKQGLFQAADGGTLFLDEIADLPLHMQVKLLRAIQEKQVRPVGAAKEIPVDIRILSATHRNLAELVKQGQFRQDLFYRVNVIELYIPPLRERIEDIPDLVAKILAKLKSNDTTSEYHQQTTISDKAIKSLQAYSFPGNVRELENLLERAVTLCENNIIKPQDLQLPDEKATLPNHQEQAGFRSHMEEVERKTIMNALAQTHGNKAKAAKLLSISYSTLRYRIQKHKIEYK